MLRYLAVGRLTKVDGEFQAGQHKLITARLVNPSDSNEKEYKDHVMKIMDKGSKKLQPGQRLRLSADGKEHDLHVQAHAEGSLILVFFGVVGPDFGKAKSGQALMNDFIQGFMKANSISEIQAAGNSDSKIRRQSEMLLDRLVKDYGQDKLAQVSSRVDEVRVTMQSNVGLALDNVQTASDMEDKAAQLENQGAQFQNRATSVRRQQQCQYYKVTALIALVLIIIIIIIVVSVTQS